VDNLENNYSQFSIHNSETGEVIADFEPKPRQKKYYVGPREYWRIMQLYNKIMVTVGTKAGNHLLIELQNHMDTETYRIRLNATHLAEDMGLSRVSVSQTIKRFVELDVIKPVGRGMYFVNPDLLWSKDLSDDVWQELKKEYAFQ